MPLGDLLGQRRVNVPRSVSQAIDLTASSPTLENEAKPRDCQSVFVPITDFLMRADAIAPEDNILSFAPALEAVGITHAEEFFNADDSVLQHDVKLRYDSIELMKSIASEMMGEEKTFKLE